MSNTTEQATSGQIGLTFDETGLIRQIQAGQTALLADLIGRYQDRVYNLALRMTGSPDDACDLAQETFTRAIKSIGQFRGHSRFYTWLVRILINISSDVKAKAKHERDLQDQMQHILGRSQAAQMVQDQDPQTRAQNRELIDLVWQGINLLDLPQRQVLLLRDVEQMSYEEIAQILKIGEGTVKSRLFRARESLREFMAGRLDAAMGEER